MILYLDYLWRDCVMRERMMITFGSSKGSQLRAWNGKVCWLYVVGVVCLYVHLCLYVYTSCLFTYFFLTQIMKGKANWLCRTYWLIFRSRCTPKKISKKVSTSQVTVLDSVKKGRLDQLISSLISTFFLWKKQGVHELLCFFPWHVVLFLNSAISTGDRSDIWRSGRAQEHWHRTLGRI